jgi:hypothetical protein
MPKGRYRSLAALLIITVWLLPLAASISAQRAPKPVAPHPMIVDVRIHGDYKATFEYERSAPYETANVHAEFTVSHDFSQRMQWLGYDNVPGGMVPIEGQKGLSSGTFHYFSEDNHRNDKLSDKITINTAGSIDPNSQGGSVQIGEGDSEVKFDATSEKTMAACKDIGNTGASPDYCGPIHIPGMIGIDQTENKGPAYSRLEFGYELRASSELPPGAENVDAVGGSVWYGSVTSGKNESFDVSFDGKRSGEDQHEDQYTKTAHREEHLHVTPSVRPTAVAPPRGSALLERMPAEVPVPILAGRLELAGLLAT